MVMAAIKYLFGRHFRLSVISFLNGAKALLGRWVLFAVGLSHRELKDSVKWALAPFKKGCRFYPGRNIKVN